MSISIFEEEKERKGSKFKKLLIKKLSLQDCIGKDSKVLAKYLSAFDMADESIPIDKEVREFIDTIDDSPYTGEKKESSDFTEPDLMEKKINLLLDESKSNYIKVLQDSYGQPKFAGEKARVIIAELKLDIKPLFESVSSELEEMKVNENYEFSRTLKVIRKIIDSTGNINEKAKDKLRKLSVDVHTDEYRELLNGVKKYLQNAKKRNVLVKFTWG